MAVAVSETTGSFHQERAQAVAGMGSARPEEVGPHGRQTEIAVSDAEDYNDHGQWKLETSKSCTESRRATGRIVEATC